MNGGGTKAYINDIMIWSHDNLMKSPTSKLRVLKIGNPVDKEEWITCNYTYEIWCASY